MSLRRAVLRRGLGRVTVSAGVGNSAHPLSTADTEHVRLHAYWTRRTLERVPLSAPLTALVFRHERMDGSGCCRRGTGGPRLSQTGRVLAAADVFAAPTEPRTHRDAHPAEAAAILLSWAPVRVLSSCTRPA
ncbi:HD-GYP domain-containing protein [Streptomyces griseoviridis]|uniref:HD-GYP domain-containing protein n=1 Tax=Streptomyces griseoviridis TaxID=45398 RepID=UPI0035714363